MPYIEGDEVLVQLSRNELVVGEVVETDFPDVFSEGWKILVLITEGGHPRYGQVSLHPVNEVSLKGDAA